MGYFQRVLRVCLSPFLKTVVTCFPVLGVSSILFIIYNDEFLSRHAIAAVVLSFWFLATCCLMVLSKICLLRRKSFAKKTAIRLLWDTDLKLENETEEVPYYDLTFYSTGFFLKLLFKNPYEFCKFRPAYGMFLVTGLVFLVALVVFLTQAKVWSKQDDFYSVTEVLAFPIAFLTFIVYLLADSGIYVAEKEVDEYVPFDVFVQIPMKVLVGKTVATFVTSGLVHAILVLYLLSLTTLGIISLNYIHHAPEGMLITILPKVIPNPHRFVTIVMVLTSVSCFNVLCGLILSCFIQVKLSIFGIMENNWQRNLAAIEFLLPNTEVETLKDLKFALDRKRDQQLRTKERLAFEYISRPLWKTKQPFMDRWLAEAAPSSPPAQQLEEDDVPQQADVPEEIQQDQAARQEGAEPQRVDQDQAAAPGEVEPGDLQQQAAMVEDEDLEQDAQQRPSTPALRQRRQKQIELLNLDDTPAGAAKRRRAAANVTPRNLRPRKQQ